MRYLLITLVLTFVLDTKHSRAQTQFGSEELLALDVQAKDPLFVDFNGDAFIDIIDYDDSGIKVQLNNGIGGFFESDLIYGVLEASTLAAEDLDQDGDPDILFVVKTVPFERKLGVLWNDGTGQITPESIDLEAGVVKSLLIDDLDNDGHTDLVALYDRDNDLWYDVIFYKQTAEAGFEDAVFLYEKYDDTSMRIHDTDDDGLEDFIFLWQNDTRIYTNKNLGGLVFDLFVPFLTFTRAITNFDLVDFDKDGDNDILLTTTAIEDSDVGSELIVVENKGDGVHIPISIFSYAVNEAFLKFDHTDIEGDGDTDIVFLNGLNQELWFIRNLGNFEFSQPVSISETDILVVGGIECLDWDNDGDPDILVSQSNNSNTSLFQNMPALPEASFDYVHCLGEMVNTSTAYLPNSTYLWDFGNGDQSTELQPSLVPIEELGYHVVSLTVCNDAGCDTSSEVLDLSQAVNIDIPLIGRVDDPIVFTDQSPGYTNRSWVFGDGNVSTEAIALNSYSSAGSYEVELFLTNSTILDCTKQIKREIEIVAGQDCDELSSEYLIDFNIPETGTVGNEVLFSDNSDGFTNWIWQFGDGNFSTNQNTTHVYVAPGVHTIQLTLKDSNEGTCSNTFSTEIVITGPQADDFKPLFSEPTTVYSGAKDVYSFLVYPNPCVEECEIALPNVDNWRLNLFDSKGSEVLVGEFKADRFKLDTAKLVPGVYLVQITDSNGVSVRRKILRVRI